MQLTKEALAIVFGDVIETMSHSLAFSRDKLDRFVQPDGSLTLRSETRLPGGASISGEIRFVPGPLETGPTKA